MLESEKTTSPLIEPSELKMLIRDGKIHPLYRICYESPRYSGLFVVRYGDKIITEKGFEIELSCLKELYQQGLLMKFVPGMETGANMLVMSPSEKIEVKKVREGVSAGVFIGKLLILVICSMCMWLVFISVPLITNYGYTFAELPKLFVSYLLFTS